MNSTTNIVILTEDHLLKENIINRIKQNSNYQINTFSCSQECIDYLATNSCDLLIVDMLLTNIDGIGVINQIKKVKPYLHIICISDFINGLVLEILEKMEVDYCLKKPLDYDYFMNVVARVVNNESSNCEEKLIVKNKIQTIFMKFGMPQHFKGYSYLITGISLVNNDINLLSEITKELYPQIARIHGTTASRVEQAIRHLLKITWERGNQEELKQIFGYRAVCKPCNSEFIATITDFLLSRKKYYD